jgi:hypothetical protein
MPRIGIAKRSMDEIGWFFPREVHARPVVGKVQSNDVGGDHIIRRIDFPGAVSRLEASMRPAERVGCSSWILRPVMIIVSTLKGLEESNREQF